MKMPVYLDYNATAPLRPEVMNMVKDVHNQPLNASAMHHFGRQGRKIIEQSRRDIAATINSPATQIIFNSGATEGNNTVLNHFTQERILVSAIEHPSILEAAPQAERIPVTHDGIIDLKKLDHLLKEKPTALVSVMMVNNETGVIQPMEDIIKCAKSHGALVHCDAVQAINRIPVDMQALGIDFLTFCAHKIGGPQGIGALALGLCGITPTMMIGGGQEKAARAGTENVAAIAGFAAAIKTKTQPLDTLQRKLEDWLTTNTNAKIYGKNVPRVTNTTFFSLPEIRAETVLMALDLEGIALSNGSACSSGTVKPSPVLQAMGADATEALSALRISTGWATTETEIDICIEKLDAFLKRTKQ